MNVAVWFLIGILQGAPTPVAEFYPEPFDTQEECMEMAIQTKLKGYPKPMACISIDNWVPVGNPV